MSQFYLAICKTPSFFAVADSFIEIVSARQFPVSSEMVSVVVLCVILLLPGTLTTAETQVQHTKTALALQDIKGLQEITKLQESSGFQEIIGFQTGATPRYKKYLQQISRKTKNLSNKDEFLQESFTSSSLYHVNRPDTTLHNSPSVQIQSCGCLQHFQHNLRLLH